MTANKERKKKSGAAKIFSRSAPEVPACPRGEGKDKRAVAAFNANPAFKVPDHRQADACRNPIAAGAFLSVHAGALAPQVTENVEFGRFPWCA
jgi:hypothetical protein